MEILYIFSAALLLFIGLFDLHIGYGFYTFLRWVVSISALLFAYNIYKIKPESKLIGIALFAVLFNPIAPIYMEKNVWKIIDIITGIIFLFSLLKYFDIKNNK